MELVDFASGEVDVAIRYGAGPYPGLETIRLMRETVIPVMSPELLAREPLVEPGDLARHILLHDGSPGRRRQLPGLADVAGGAGGEERRRHARAALQPVEPGDRGGGRRPRRGAGQARPGPGRPRRRAAWSRRSQISTAVDFAYYVVHPKAKGRLPQVKAFVGWLRQEAASHDQAMATMDNGAGI